MENQQNNNLITTEIVEKLIKDKSARIAVVRESHYWFFHFYFSEYTKYKTAPFQKEMIEITENETNKLAVIVAFRGSAKSTIMTMSYPIWAILGKQQKKCVVILSQTQQQTKTHFSNIKRELETNDLLRNDLGPFEEESDEWGSFSLVLPRFNAKIIAASSEQGIRGLRHGSHRPDLIICDDVEDIKSVKTRDGRNRTHTWFTGEIMPLGDKGTRVIMVGNLLHEDSLLMRVKESMESNPENTIYKEYPIIDENNEILWKGKYSSIEEIESERVLNGNEVNWQREYMLKILSSEDQVVQREWIQYYDELPFSNSSNSDGYRGAVVGVDLAISEKETADYTAMVTGYVFNQNENTKVYIAPNPVNKRMNFPDTQKKIKEIGELETFGYSTPEIYIEDVGYQKAIIESLNKDGFWRVYPFAVHGSDKRSRLNSITPLLESGNVLFPRHGAEELIQQLMYFGVEKHDDLMDAFVMVLSVVIDKKSYNIKLYNKADLGL
jgi:predicted phage terminase large subunit-like protein